MAVDTTIDNAVIDFASISNLLQTLKTHDDLFMKFASGSFGAYTQVGTKQSVPMAASVFQMVGVRVAATMKKNTPKRVEVVYGKSFATVPTVVATAGNISDKTSLNAQIEGEPGLDKCTVLVTSSSTAFAGEFTLNVLALGPSQDL